MEEQVPSSASASAGPSIPDRLFFRIGDVADIVGVKPYVLRYWETEFPAVSPDKSNTGQRVYRRKDVEMLLLIRHLLHQERYSIEGARKRIRELQKQKHLKDFRDTEVLKKAPAGEEFSKKAARLSKMVSDLERLARVQISDFFKL